MNAKRIAHKIHQMAAQYEAEQAQIKAEQEALERARQLGKRRAVTDEAISNLLGAGDTAKYLGDYVTANLCFALVLQALSEVGSTHYALVLEDAGMAYYDLLGVRDRESDAYLCIPWPLLNLAHKKFANPNDSVYYCHCDMSCYPSRFTGCKNRVEWFADTEKLASQFGVAVERKEKEIHDRTHWDCSEAEAVHFAKLLQEHIGYSVVMLTHAGIKIGSAPQWLVEVASHNGEETPLRKPAFDALLQIMESFKNTARYHSMNY